VKVAICSQGPDLGSEVDPRFGRCPYFIVVDPDTREFEAVENPNVDAAHGAGTQAAQLVGGCGVGAVLAGNVGPNPVRALGAAGIDIYVGISGTVEQALNDYLEGKLSKASAPTVGSHFGTGRGMGRGPGGGGSAGRGGRGSGREAGPDRS